MHVITSELLHLDNKEIAEALRMYARGMGLGVASYARVEIMECGGHAATVHLKHSNRDI